MHIKGYKNCTYIICLSIKTARVCAPNYCIAFAAGAAALKNFPDWITCTTYTGNEVIQEFNVEVFFSRSRTLRGRSSSVDNSC